MALAVLPLELAFLAAAFGWRTLIEWRRTGDTGWRLRAEGPGAATVSRIALVVALLLAVAVPVADLAGLDRWGALDRPVVAAAGLVLMVVGSVVTVWAQFAMGRSWRIGVDTSERTELVTRGPFRSVRNPIYTAMLVTVTGIALAIPNVLAGILLALALCALEIQVRAVEEPYLRATHRQEYAAYLARTGRFVPGVGRATSP